MDNNQKQKLRGILDATLTIIFALLLFLFEVWVVLDTHLFGFGDVLNGLFLLPSAVIRVSVCMFAIVILLGFIIMLVVLPFIFSYYLEDLLTFLLFGRNKK